ncbi:MAG: hypothetical protein BGO78_12445 [Chloroflexi bacterium 44-23]|nr:MAG: hypothetical protein BGO78_12445 [Chloroflexi bacterium 44-23]
MATSEERLRILQMIQDGVINAEDGIRLLDSIEQSVQQPSPANPQEDIVDPERQARFFRVRVTDTDSGKTRVNVRLPISVVNAGFKMGARFSPTIEGLNSAELMQFIQSGTIGRIIDVYDDDDGEHVEVFLE